MGMDPPPPTPPPPGVWQPADSAGRFGTASWVLPCKAAFSVQRSAISVRRSAFGDQRSAFSVQRPHPTPTPTPPSPRGVWQPADSAGRFGTASWVLPLRAAFSVQRSAFRKPHPTPARRRSAFRDPTLSPSLPSSDIEKPCGQEAAELHFSTLGTAKGEGYKRKGPSRWTVLS